MKHLFSGLIDELGPVKLQKGRAAKPQSAPELANSPSVNPVKLASREQEVGGVAAEDKPTAAKPPPRGAKGVSHRWKRPNSGVPVDPETSEENIKELERLVTEFRERLAQGEDLLDLWIGTDEDNPALTHPNAGVAIKEEIEDLLDIANVPTMNAQRYREIETWWKEIYSQGEAREEELQQEPNEEEDAERKALEGGVWQEALRQRAQTQKRLRVGGGLIGLIVLGAIVCGLFYGGLFILTDGLIREDASFWGGVFFIFLGVALCRAGVRPLYKTVTAAVGPGKPVAEKSTVENMPLRPSTTNTDAESEQVCNIIFGYVQDLTEEYGHWNLFPRNNDPIREWIASLWESQLKDGLAKLGVLANLPVLSSKASATRFIRLIRQDFPSLPREAFQVVNDIVEMRTAYSAGDVAEHLDSILNGTGASVVLCIVEGEVSVFTKKLGTQCPPEFLRKCSRDLQIKPDAVVAWHPTTDAEPLETMAATALYGETPAHAPSRSAAGDRLRRLRQESLPSHPLATDYAI
jgi:hypothetical protein